jgi:hypothetical protein
VEGDIITISGMSWDNFGVERVEVAMDDGDFIVANGTGNWFIEWDIGEFDLDDHMISARAVDLFGKNSIHRISVIVNESGHVWGPQINNFYHKPEKPINISNVVIYANLTNTSPFDIKRVVLYFDNGTEIDSFEMYRYGDNPVQERHEEDPLFNESNEPIFGFELGQFSTGEKITYWIVSYDTANNFEMSEKKSFIVGSFKS